MRQTERLVCDRSIIYKLRWIPIGIPLIDTHIEVVVYWASNAKVDHDSIPATASS